MSEPFRDEMSAALTRAEKLAEENQDLREELRRLRETAHSVREKAPDDALATQTLAVLERLEAATHVDPVVKAPTAIEHADPSTLTGRPHPRLAPEAVLPPPPSKRTGLGAGTLVVACFICLFVGIMLGAMTR